MPEFVDYYALLGLAPAATAEEIAAAFRREGFRWHPDRNPDRAAEASDRFIRLTEALAVLTDPRSRRQYDARWRQQFSPRTANTVPSSLRRAVADALDVVDRSPPDRGPTGVSSGSTLEEARARRAFERQVETLRWDLATQAQAARRARAGITAVRGVLVTGATVLACLGIQQTLPWGLVGIGGIAITLAWVLSRYALRALLERQAEAHRSLAEHLVRRRDPKAPQQR